MAKHCLAVAFQVLVEPNTGGRLGQHHGQRFFAAFRRITPQIVAIQFDQIEGVEEYAFIVVAIANKIERSHAIVIASNRLAIDDARAGPQAGQRIDDQREAVAPQDRGRADACLTTSPYCLFAKSPKNN
jgi:hypothetical protein